MRPDEQEMFERIFAPRHSVLTVGDAIRVLSGLLRLFHGHPLNRRERRQLLHSIRMRTRVEHRGRVTVRT